MNRSYRFLVLASIIILAAFFINAENSVEKKTYSSTSNRDTSDYVDNNYRIKALKIPNNLSFAGEKVELDKTDIRERIDRELLVNTYWQSNALLWFKRTHKYFPVIEPILKEKGVPDDFKYLSVIESDLRNVTSPAGAKGMWQMLKDAGRENGLEINSNVDERYHLEKATRAACDYLIAAKERLGSWTLAAAAYHAGNYGIEKRLEQQMVDSYYDVLAGENTERYIPRIVAAKEILSHPEKYGFEFDKEDLYEMGPTYTVKVDTAITNIAHFAQKFGTNYKELKMYNPWLRENKLNNKTRRLYEIKIPE
ncbi:lytic transglycosylase domain-containing protein [Lutimonas zeaxanthinifaciens]|uniref:lytic transglycosylase domain-containing protein n=1 Tax=Lutimonas zeaxanthinifaciens TaxID=3060215 RepID=UPI00265D2604|nr:lytic transglycosylase domain-containing protein [Lutimonas sp. YSD2104]WKK64803.1 lytic transglycosylase domain-containing protein [Lutimonas sp. YSD2104]